MVKIIMHGCNGHMGQVISGLVEKDPDAEIVAGIDVAQMHFLLTVRNANSRLYYVQPV